MLRKAPTGRLRWLALLLRTGSRDHVHPMRAR
jgi:hypothetical protein